MGGYFITACTQNRKILFDKEPVQKLIEKWWWELANKFPTIELDAFVIMPNHIHGIIFLKGIEENIGVAFDRKLEDDDTADVGVDLCVNPKKVNHKKNIKGRHKGLPEQETALGELPTLGTIVQWFKTMITNEYIVNVKSQNWNAFNKRLFQRNYYEHIIRNNESLNRIRHYILTNPDRWEKDIENPKNMYEKGRVVYPNDSFLETYYQSIVEKD